MDACPLGRACRLPGMGPGADDGKGMRMDFNKIVEIISERKGAVAAAAPGIAALGGLAWALSTGPLTPVGDGAGPAGSMGSHSPAAVGSAEPDDDAPVDPEEDPASAEEAGPAAGDPTGPEPQSPAAGSGGGAGDPGKQQAPSQAASKPSQGEPKPPAPKPSNQHSWTAVYRSEPVYGQQWVSKWEDVYTRHERWACGCGQTFDNWNSCTAHRAAMAEAGNPCGRVVDDSYTTVEKVDRGSYQTIQAGSKQVLDHYECSCGATR